MHTHGLLIARPAGFFVRLLTTGFLLFGFSHFASAQPSDDPATHAAMNLMNQSVQVSSDGQHNRMLQALRHLRDPDLRPLFAELVHAGHPAIRINAILGLAELSSNGKLDMKLLAMVDDANVQNEIITAALDDGLLSMDDAKQLMAWPSLSDGVKLLIALRLMRDGNLEDTSVIEKAMNSDMLGRRGLAGLILSEMGDPRGYNLLKQVSESTSPQRDAVRMQTLQVADEHNMRSAGPWAYSVAIEPNISSRLELLALRAALRFNEPQATDRWIERFRHATEPADRTRLAIIALEAAQSVNPRVFELMQSDNERLIAQMGRVAQAVARQSDNLAEEIVSLIEMDHPIVNGWVYRYARDEASQMDAQIILLGLVLAYNHSEPRRREQRLDDAIAASQTLMNQSPDAAVTMLRPILANDQTNALLVQAILHGLISSQERDAYRVIDGLDPFINVDARALALLLKTHRGGQLSERDLRQLALIVRGASVMPDTFRMQAAWAYLKNTGQADQALAQLIGR